MKNQKHSELPWVSSHCQKTERLCIDSVGGDEVYGICQMDWGDENRDNANFILKACNSHYDILAIAEEYLQSEKEMLETMCRLAKKGILEGKITNYPEARIEEKEKKIKRIQSVLEKAKGE